MKTMLAETVPLAFIWHAAVTSHLKAYFFLVQKRKHFKDCGCLYLLCPKRSIEQKREAEALFYQRTGSSNLWRVSEDFYHEVKT